MARDWVGTARRAVKKPPRVLASRLVAEARVEAERLLGPRRGRTFDRAALLRATRSNSVCDLWDSLLARPYAARVEPIDTQAIECVCPGETDRVLRAAEDALARRVDLLGSGTVELGSPIAWSRDFKSGLEWPGGYGPRIDYVQLELPNDVKVPWELSRLQWLLPAGQAYLLTGDDRFAVGARDILDEWIDANPYAATVNWAIAMEAAIRILTWTWLFHAFGRSSAWRGTVFRERFLRTLWLHGDFVDRHFELSEVNGNHTTADAAGLVFAGLFLDVPRWHEKGWRVLVAELPRQVTADGVDYEQSTAYHRLVTELFVLPALYRVRSGRDVPSGYRVRLASMARFAAAYSRPDGSTPLWGDADDGRALPLGAQPLNDHRYLSGVVALALDDDDLLARSGGSRSEAAWLYGVDRAARLHDGMPDLPSTPFPHGGVYVLRGGRDHVFVDCGPVGLAGRGGHGHDDCLSFEAVLDGVHLVTDCGSYVYTASADWRNRFRSTGFHNTPEVDGEGQNRPGDSLWSVGYEAVPDVRAWITSRTEDLLTASHRGYLRLSPAVRPVRTLVLDRERHALAVRDDFEGTGEHVVRCRLHLPAGIVAEELGSGRWLLASADRRFVLRYGDPDDWDVKLEAAWVSPRYGIRVETRRIVLTRRGELRPLLAALLPAENEPEDVLGWAQEVTRGTAVAPASQGYR